MCPVSSYSILYSNSLYKLSQLLTGHTVIAPAIEIVERSFLIRPRCGATIDACMPRSSTSATSAGLASATGLWPPYFILDKGNMKQLLSYVAFLN